MQLASTVSLRGAPLRTAAPPARRTPVAAAARCVARAGPDEQQEHAEHRPATGLPRREVLQSALTLTALTAFPSASLATPRRLKVAKVKPPPRMGKRHATRGREG